MAASTAGTSGKEPSDTVNMIFVNAPRGMNAADRAKLTDYVKVRLKDKDVHLTLNPANFPWPSSATARKATSQGASGR